VFWTRFLFTAGFQIIIQFLQYFMRDAVPSPYEFAGLLSLDDPEAAVSFFVGMVTLGSVVSALLSGTRTITIISAHDPQFLRWRACGGACGVKGICRTGTGVRWWCTWRAP
jgi:hypothetical protein